MLKVKVYFNNSANLGSRAIDAIAITLGGDWSEKSSTDDMGIVTNVDSANREWAEEVLESDEDVESYVITEE